MRRIPVSLTEILRRYSFSHTQLTGSVVPYQVHGALGAPSDEADLGPARFWTGVHRRERCRFNSDGGRLARRLVRVVRRWPTGPGERCFLARSRQQPFAVARAAVAKHGSRGSPPAAQADREPPAKPTKMALQRFHTARSADSPSLSYVCTFVCCLRRPGASPGPVPARFFWTCRPLRPHLSAKTLNIIQKTTLASPSSLRTIILGERTFIPDLT